MEQIILDNKKCITWYAKNCKAATIDQLLDCKSKLITNNYYLAEKLTDLKKDYNFCYYSRKIEFAKSKNGFIKASMSATRAESEAMEVNSEILKNELDYESAAYRLETLLKHFDNVANDIMQRISVLKIENKNNL
jgi:hypothetical protein